MNNRREVGQELGVRLWRRRLIEVLGEQAGLGLIEVMTAMVILTVGMLAIAGISLQVSAQNRMATWQTDQALAAQQIMERMQIQGYAAAASGSDTISIGNRVYTVTRVVTTPANRVKRVQLSVQSPQAKARTFVTQMYQNRQLPAAP